MLQTELKTLRQARNLNITGSKGVLIDRLVQQDQIVTERQARRVLKVRTEAAARGVKLELKVVDLTPED